MSNNTINPIEKARLDKFCKDFCLELTIEEVYSQVDRETTIYQIISELEQAAEIKA